MLASLLWKKVLDFHNRITESNLPVMGFFSRLCSERRTKQSSSLFLSESTEANVRREESNTTIAYLDFSLFLQVDIVCFNFVDGYCSVSQCHGTIAIGHSVKDCQLLLAPLPIFKMNIAIHTNGLKNSFPLGHLAFHVYKMFFLP